MTIRKRAPRTLTCSSTLYISRLSSRTRNYSFAPRGYEIPVCVVLSGASSLEVLANLDAKEYPAPVLVLSGRSYIPSAVEAIRNGASDFIEKRLDAGAILDRVRTAIGRWGRCRQDDDLSERALPSLPGYDRLTSRE